MHEPNSHEFDVILVAVRTAGGGASPLDVRIVFDTGWDTYDREFEIFNLYHSSPEVRGDGPPDGLIPGKTVRVEIRLDDALAREHFEDASEDEVAKRLLALAASEPQHDLLETESWFLIAATQAIVLGADAPAAGSLREGFQTKWAGAATVSRQAEPDGH